MNKTSTHYFLHISCLLLALLSWQACTVDLDAPTPYLGNLRIQRYVAIGDSYTAGFANGGLYAKAQQQAFPQLFASQFQALGLDRVFRAPLLANSGSGYFELTGLRSRACDLIEPLAEMEYHAPVSNWAANVSGQGPYENIGIPGLSLRSVSEPLYSTRNAYFARLAAHDSVMLPQLIAEQEDFDFFTLWLGIDELMPYALSGGTVSADAFIDPEVFRTNYQTLLEQLLEGGMRKGVMANLPDILEFPYFSHVPHTSINLPECVNVELAVYIVSGSGNVQIASENDRILLPAANLVGLNGFGLSESTAVPDEWVLDAEEAHIVRGFLGAYNQAIAEVNQEMGNQYPHCLSLLDMNRYFKQELIPSHISEGIAVSGKYLSGSVFSLDGHSLTARGNALVANQFIGATNNYFSTRIPTLNISDYPGVEFP
jgi:hypothetical protein